MIPAARHLCRTDLYFLLRHVLNRKDAEHPWIYERCREIEREPDGFLDLWSREHYKSAIITYAKTIQDILASHGEGALVEREVCAGIFSHSRGIAKRFLRQIKFELESNGKLKEWFPDILWDNPQKQSPKWSEDDGIVVRRKSNPAEATVEAWGVVDGQPIGKHFPLLVYDDVVVPESVTTPDMLQKTSDMLALSFALGAEGGARRFIGTRYHANDAYKTIIDRGTAKPRIHLLTKNGQADGEPVLRSPEWVQDKRRDMGPYIFACFTFDTGVLMADWSEKSIRNVAVGEYVIGYTFGNGERAKLVRTKVVARQSRMMPVVRFTFESGRTITGTRDHKFWSGRAGRTYSPLGFGYGELKAACSVYDPRRVLTSAPTWASGYLAGMFDGEGSVTGGTVHIAQSHDINPGICDRIETAFEQCGVDYGVHRPKSRPGHRDYYVRGGREALMRFLHVTRGAVKGERLALAMLNAGSRNIGKGSRDKLVSIEELGEQEVFNIQTEAGNYVANGYAVKNCQMLQNPQADETQGFQEEWIKYHDGFTRMGMNVYLLFDPAGAKNKRSDYTSGWAVGLAPDQNLYVLDMVRDRLNLTQRAQLVMRWHRKWKPMGVHGVRYEKIGMQADIEHIQEVQRQQNYRFDVTEVGGAIPKIDRIKRLIPYFEQRRVYLPRTHYYTDYQGKTEDLIQAFLQQEYKPFPVSVHDDMLDALARLIEPEFPLIWPEASDHEDRLEPEVYED